jgi:HK97 family phage portal protein
MVSSGRWLTVFDSFTGAWQTDTSLDQQSILRQSTVYACIRQIANDISKLPLLLIAPIAPRSNVWQPVENPAYTPLLRKPNAFQTRLEFFFWWLASLLIQGNTYALKLRDGRGIVQKLVVLDPFRVVPLVSPRGEIFYQLDSEHLAGLQEQVTVPSVDIIHQKYMPLNHPLIGCAPLQVAGNSASAALSITKHTKGFYSTAARPAGVLEAPKEISQEQADAIQKAWQEFQKPENQGKVAVLENGLKFNALSISAVDSQTLETLKYTAEDICVAFGVPAWKIGAAPFPTSNNAELSERVYYAQTLQPLIEGIELLIDEGLDLSSTLGVEFDLKHLLRLDSMARIKFWSEGTKGGIFSPDEARADFNLAPVPGGATPYLQQQNFSLAALAKRDAKEDPFAAAAADTAAASDPSEDEEPLPDDLADKVESGELTESEARELAEERYYEGISVDALEYFMGRGN